jgi:hypothetical protein
MSETPAYLDAILTDRYRIERELGRPGDDVAVQTDRTRRGSANTEG